MSNYLLLIQFTIYVILLSFWQAIRYPIPYVIAIFIKIDQLISQTTADTRVSNANYHDIGDMREMTRPVPAKIALMASVGMVPITAISLAAAATFSPHFAFYPPLYLAYILLITVLYSIFKRLRRAFVTEDK